MAYYCACSVWAEPSPIAVAYPRPSARLPKQLYDDNGGDRARYSLFPVQSPSRQAGRPAHRYMSSSVDGVPEVDKQARPAGIDHTPRRGRQYMMVVSGADPAGNVHHSPVIYPQLTPPSHRLHAHGPEDASITGPRRLRDGIPNYAAHSLCPEDTIWWFGAILKSCPGKASPGSKCAPEWGHLCPRACCHRP